MQIAFWCHSNMSEVNQSAVQLQSSYILSEQISISNTFQPEKQNRAVSDHLKTADFTLFITYTLHDNLAFIKVHRVFWMYFMTVDFCISLNLIQYGLKNCPDLKFAWVRSSMSRPIHTVQMTTVFHNKVHCMTHCLRQV